MKTILLLSFMLATSSVLAQQDPLYAQYMLNPLVINPAYAGLNNHFNGMVGYRLQWTGFDGPRMLNASVNTSLVDNKVGAGLLVMNDQTGATENLEVNASFAYKIHLNESVFSFGMQASIQNYRTDISKLNVFNPDDNAFTGGEKGTRLNIGTGLILSSEKYFIGLSVPRLLPTTFTNGGQEFTLYDQHAYLMAGYVHYLNEHVRIRPSVLVKGVTGAPVSVDLGLGINIDNLHTASLFTRNFNTYGFLVQTLLKEKYRFGYAFELPTNKSVGAQFISHDITLGIQLSLFDFHDRTPGIF
jgi:type IX secretion system PorP/SprF family membrane protein